MEFFIIVLVIIAAFISAMVKSSKETLIQNCITFDKTSNVVTLKKRSSDSSSVLSIEAVHEFIATYNPAKIKYSGVSGGGISFGETTFEAASYDMKALGKSGKYRLLIKNNGEKYPVNEIELSPSVYDDAKKDSRIKKFLVGNKLVLKYDNEDCKLTAAEEKLMMKAIGCRDDGMMFNATRRAIIAQALNLSDCEYIKAWIGGN